MTGGGGGTGGLQRRQAAQCMAAVGGCWSVWMQQGRLTEAGAQVGVEVAACRHDAEADL